MNNRKLILDREGKQTQKLFNEDMYDNLRAMMEHGELLLLDDDDIKASLRSVQMELREDVHGLTKVRIYGNDSHIAEGLIRASWLAKKERNKNMSIRYI